VVVVDRLSQVAVVKQPAYWAVAAAMVAQETLADVPAVARAELVAAAAFVTTVAQAIAVAVAAAC
jgi:hypothetical protein